MVVNVDESIGEFACGQRWGSYTVTASSNFLAENAAFRNVV